MLSKQGTRAVDVSQNDAAQRACGCLPKRCRRCDRCRSAFGPTSARRSRSHEQRGISHLVEHMLFKGTQRRSARAIAETMDGVGGNLNAFTDKETTCYYAKVIDRHVPLAMDVIADMFLNSVFDPHELAQRAEGRAGRDQDVRGLARRADPRSLPADDVERRESWRADDRFYRYGRCDSRPTICASTCAATTRPTPSSWRRPATSNTSASWNWSSESSPRFARRVRAAQAECAESDAGPLDPPQGLASRPTWWWGRAAFRYATSGATRCRCSTRCSAAACRAGSFRRFAKSAVWSTPSTRSKPRIARPDSSASTPAPRRRTCRRAST